MGVAAKFLPQARPLTGAWFTAEWPDFAEYCKFYPGQLVVLSGHAGSGKSTFMFNLLMQMAVIDGHRLLWFAPENQDYLIEKLRLMWRWSPEGFDFFLENQLFIEDANLDRWGDEPQDVVELITKLDRTAAEHKPSFVLVDPWNELEVCRARDELLTDYVGKSLRWFKRFARERGVCVIIIAHPTKAARDRDWPHMSDIEGSMHWFNKCDNGLMVRRYPDRPVTAVSIQKVRLSPVAGKNGMVEFLVDQDTGIFKPTGMGGIVQPDGGGVVPIRTQARRDQRDRR